MSLGQTINIHSNSEPETPTQWDELNERKYKKKTKHHSILYVIANLFIIQRIELMVYAWTDIACGNYSIRSCSRRWIFPFGFIVLFSILRRKFKKKRNRNRIHFRMVWWILPLLKLRTIQWLQSCCFLFNLYLSVELRMVTWTAFFGYALCTRNKRDSHYKFTWKKRFEIKSKCESEANKTNNTIT